MRPSRAGPRSRSCASRRSTARDKGRAINNLEEGWPETLTGAARRLHEAYVQHLQAQGYKIRAQILNYPDGGLGEVGIYIGW